LKKDFSALDAVQRFFTSQENMLQRLKLFNKILRLNNDKYRRELRLLVAFVDICA